MIEEKVFIVAAKRSAIGKYQGSLSQVSPVEIGAQLVQQVVDQAKLPLDRIDEVIIGNVLSTGHGQNIARQIAIKAQLPQTVPAYTLNMVCGSGLKSITEAFIKLRYGMAKAIIAGGVESMSQAAYIIDSQARQGLGLGGTMLKDSLIQDGLTDAFSQVHMGITAENIAQAYGISRQDQDTFAFVSQIKARQANDQGLFADEIVPIQWEDRKGNTCSFEKDEYINYQTNAEKLARLRPAFKADGTVTAGNASGINDGGAILCLVAESIVTELGIQPLAEIIGFGQNGLDPQMMGLGPVGAINQVLTQTGLTLSEIDTLELNEAFAAQSIAVIQELSQQHQLSMGTLTERINPKGGAIALGHPIGASGARILTTLVHELLPGQYGLASLCIGGGMGIALIIKQLTK